MSALPFLQQLNATLAAEPKRIPCKHCRSRGEISTDIHRGERPCPDCDDGYVDELPAERN